MNENIQTSLRANKFRLEDLHEHPRNARVHDLPKIKRSLARAGQYQAIVVNKGSLTGRPNEILAGHGLVKAARELGWEHLAGSYVDYDETVATVVLLADNETSDSAENDDAKLLVLLQALGNADDLGDAGFDPTDLELLLLRLHPMDGKMNPITEWDDSGLPPFESNDLGAAYTTHISFRTEEDADRFFVKMGRDKKRRWWWPESDGHIGMISNSEVSSGIVE